MAKSGASRGAKNTNSFDEQDTKKAAGQSMAYIPVGPDRHYPSDGPGSLLDRRDKDYDGPYPSDRQFPSGPVPLAKKKKTKKTRTA